MSKFVCICGNVISDVKYPSPSNGVMLSESSHETFLLNAGKLFSEFKSADMEGRRNEWTRSKFSQEYPTDAADSEILEDVLSQLLLDLAVSVIKCESCGSMHVQSKVGVNEYTTFVPVASVGQGGIVK